MQIGVSLSIERQQEVERWICEKKLRIDMKTIQSYTGREHSYIESGEIEATVPASLPGAITLLCRLMKLAIAQHPDYINTSNTNRALP